MACAHSGRCIQPAWTVVARAGQLWTGAGAVQARAAQLPTCRHAGGASQHPDQHGLSTSAVGRVDLAETNIDVALAIRHKLNAAYPLALSVNTQGVIYTLQGHPAWGVRQSRRALTMFRDMDEKRGAGLALLGLGFALRKQGGQWKHGHYQVAEAALLYEQAQDVLEQAASLFKDQAPEPIRLWEAHNELGSLFCDWAWMELKNGWPEIAAGRYSRSVRMQAIALGIARENDLAFQLTDSLDDLAQVYGERNYLLVQLDEREKADQSRRIAAHFVDSIFEQVPVAFRLKPQEGFPEVGREGNTYWQALAKAHRWRATWLFRDLEQGLVPNTDRASALEEAAQQFILCLIYTEKYWPTSLELQRRTKRFFKFLRLNRVSPNWVQMQLRRTSRRYNVPLTRLEETAGELLGV